MVGETLGSYRILSQLGAGAMGEVFLAEHRHLKRKAAVKLLARDLMGRPELLERFFLEARATSTIAHPGIVQIFDCEVDATGRPYIVMEYLTGETLAAFLARRGPLPGTLAARLARNIAEALGAAHAKEIVHRDLKPENVFVEGEPPDSIKVVDFGIAKLAGDMRAAQMHQTRTGALMGTPIYMSPEQCRDSGKTDLRTDVYSLGCVMFEMLTGKPPFTHSALGDLVVAHLTEKPKEVRAVNPAVPAELSDLVGALLQKDPAARPQTMRAVVERLEAFLARATTLQAALSPTMAVSPPAAPAPSFAAPAAAPVAASQPPRARSVHPSVPDSPPPPHSPAQPIHSTLRESAAELIPIIDAAGDAKPARSRTVPMILGVGGALAAVAAIAFVVQRQGAGPSQPAGPVVVAAPAPRPAPAPAPTPESAPHHEVTTPPPPAEPAPKELAKDPVKLPPAEHAEEAAPAPPEAESPPPPALATDATSKRPGHAKKSSGHAVAVAPATAASRPAPAPATTTAPRGLMSAADIVGTWEGPWNDPAKGQKGRLFLQLGSDGAASGWMTNAAAQQSFRMVGRLTPGGTLELACQCPAQQTFNARGALRADGAGADTELKTTLSLSSGAGVFGQSHATLRHARAR